MYLPDGNKIELEYNAYEEVTKAYMLAVHSVLTRQRNAADAVAALEKQLVEITGFKTGPLATGRLIGRR